MRSLQNLHISADQLGCQVYDQINHVPDLTREAPLISLSKSALLTRLFDSLWTTLMAGETLSDEELTPPFRMPLRVHSKRRASPASTNSKKASRKSGPKVKSGCRTCK
jgi:hypothetical protein